MATKKILAGPLALTNTLTTTIYNNASALLKTTIRHIHVVNESDSDATFSLWLGLSGANTAGTAMYSKLTVKARGDLDRYMETPISSTQFIVGGASINSALTITITGDLDAV